MMAKASDDIPVGLTEKQTETLLKFRERVQDSLTHPIRHDNYHLCRWLRARGWDIDKAEKMFRSNVAWKKKWDIDNLLDTWTPPEALVKYYPGGICGFDKENCPMWVTAMGTIDMKGLVMSATREDLIRYNLYIVEMIHRLFEEQTEKTGSRVTQLAVVIDLKGFGMKHLMSPGMEALLKVMHLVEANYPECLKQCYIVNAPTIWNLIYSICKPFMSEDTKRKIQVLGSDWKEKVLEVIEHEQFPVHWGGTQTGPNNDPYCSNKICMGGEVDDSYYLKNQLLVDPKLWKESSVAAGSKLDIPFEVSEPGAIINWLFKTEKKDIAYGIKFRQQTDDGSEADSCYVLPSKRVSCQNVPEMGQFECKNVGTYIFQFSNSFSWINSKKLGYYVHLATASEAEKNANEFAENVETP